MKYINYYETQNINNDNQKLQYVIKLDHIEFNKLTKLANAVVCLNQLDKNAQIDQTIIFVNEKMEIIGNAKLVKLITAPKQNIWMEIQNYSYLTKEKFIKMYEDSENATISVIYDLNKIETSETLPISSQNFVNEVGFVIFENKL